MAAAGRWRAAVPHAVAARAELVVALSRAIHLEPELAFAEHHAADAITDLLAREGFAVELGVAGLPTAFTATVGTGPLTVAICVEYDALPGIGHACGHHLIAGAGVAAALGLQPVAGELGLRVKVIGTPAEEHGGGKVLLLERGVFDDVDLAVMVHPLPADHGFNPRGTTSQAVGRYRATFHGRGAHAAASPHRGVNAADAAVVAQVAIGLLRQQIPGDHRVSAVVAHGGDATNIIPERAVVDFECRAYSMPEFESLLERVRRCFEAGALATGAGLEIVATEPVYEPLEHDDVLCDHWAAALESLGYDTTPGAGPKGGSTDMGNVSRVIPSIHPWVSIPTTTASIHTAEFAAAAIEPAALEVMLDAGTALALTVAGAATSAEAVTLLRARRAELAS
ncbi:amidohydrolase [Georgenia sunbinii]|uniref:amidohydrolase n=1 Tax=Georgenia sunbinii TaxID=3117728 RepID=UPI002F266F95